MDDGNKFFAQPKRFPYCQYIVEQTTKAWKKKSTYKVASFKSLNKEINIVKNGEASNKKSLALENSSYAGTPFKVASYLKK